MKQGCFTNINKSKQFWARTVRTLVFFFHHTILHSWTSVYHWCLRNITECTDSQWHLTRGPDAVNFLHAVCVSTDTSEGLLVNLSFYAPVNCMCVYCMCTNMPICVRLCSRVLVSFEESIQSGTANWAQLEFYQSICAFLFHLAACSWPPTFMILIFSSLPVVEILLRKSFKCQLLYRDQQV